MKLMEGTPTKDLINNEDTIKLIQNDVDRHSAERLNQDDDVTTSDNSDYKNDEGKFSQINNKVVLSQELECDGGGGGVNDDKIMILE